MSQLTIIRHSLSKANEEGILMGAKLDSPLSEKGIELARQKGQSLRTEGFLPTKVFTSELTRAKQTAAIILEQLGFSLDIIELAELNERDFGEHDGKPYESVLSAFEKHGDNPPSVEPLEIFIPRVIAAFNKIKAEMSGTTLVVTHSNPVMVMQAATFDPENIQKFWQIGDPPNCEGFTLEV